MDLDDGESDKTLRKGITVRLMEESRKRNQASRESVETSRTACLQQESPKNTAGWLRVAHPEMHESQSGQLIWGPNVGFTIKRRPSRSQLASDCNAHSCTQAASSVERKLQFDTSMLTSPTMRFGGSVVVVVVDSRTTCGVHFEAEVARKGIFQVGGPAGLRKNLRFEYASHGQHH